MTSESTQSIEIPFPSDGNPHLRLTVAPARLHVTPGDEHPWVAGTFVDPTGQMPLSVKTEGGAARISSNRNVTALRKSLPDLSLRLGTAKPFALTIETGGTDGSHCDLGGIPLTSFDTRYGAGKYSIDFSKPNPQEMSKIQVGAGAGEMTIRNLANANAGDISIDVGAIQLSVDFGGKLQRDARVRLNSGMALTTVSVPQTTAAKIKITSTLGSQTIGDGFTIREGAYWSPAAIDGKTPVLHIDATTALGTLKVLLTTDEKSPT